jgi:hypothetical protein
MRWIFRGTGAFVGRIESETRVAFWPNEPVDHGFDPSRLITVDLARTPSAASLGEIAFDDVEVDDGFSGPGGDLRGTTIGPRWPEIQVIGAVHLEQGFCDRLPADLRPALPPRHMGGRDYEYLTALYWPGSDDPRAGKRYAGHHAELLEQRGSLAQVAVFPQGASDRPGAQPTVMWIDLSSPEQTDAGPGGLTEIGLGRGASAGALFLMSTALSPRSAPRRERGSA